MAVGHLVLLLVGWAPALAKRSRGPICEPGIDFLSMTFCPTHTKLDADTQLCCNKDEQDIYCAPPLQMDLDGIACPDTHPYAEDRDMCCGPGTTLKREPPEEEGISPDGLSMSRRKKSRRRKTRLITVRNGRRTGHYKNVLPDLDFEQSRELSRVVCRDVVPPGAATSSCPLRRHLCTDPMFESIMRSQCPKTCGYCAPNSYSTVPNRRVYPGDEDEDAPCQDKMGVNGKSECQKHVMKCHDPAFARFMRAECPATCGFCRKGRLPSNAMMDYDYLLDDLL